MMAIMYGHFNDPPPPLESLRSDCPVALRDSVLRMLEKDPLRRWPTIEDSVAVVGTPTLAHDDPTRSQLIELAKSGPAFQAFVAAQASIPQSPVPKTRARVPTPSTSAPTTRMPAPRTPASRPVVAEQRKSKRGLMAGGAIAAIAAAVVVYLAPWKQPPVTAPVAAPETAETTPAATPPPETPAPEPTASEASPPASAAPAPQTTKPLIDPNNRAQAKRDAADFQRMKTQAEEARDHALGFGATSTDLAGGDMLRSQSETFAKRGKFGDALKPMSDATVVYMAAARTAQSRAETQTRITAPPVVVETKPTPPAPAPAPAAAAPTANPESVSPKTTEPAGSVAAKPPAAPPDERPAVEQVISAYAAALAAGDMGELLRTYPGMPADVQSSLRDYFKAGNSLDTSKWHISDIVVSGNNATAKIGGTMTAKDHRGKVSSQNPPRSAHLERGSSGWRIVGLN
jgi:hypothetical protein